MNTASGSESVSSRNVVSPESEGEYRTSTESLVSQRGSTGKLRHRNPKKNENLGKNQLFRGTTEELILARLDNFLHMLETRLNRLEEIGINALDQFDEGIQNAYNVLLRIRHNAIGEGWKKVEAFTDVIEAHYKDLFAGYEGYGDEAEVEEMEDNDKVDEHGEDEQEEHEEHGTSILQTLVLLEAKLSHIEETVSGYVDETISNAIDVALNAAKTRLLTYDEMPPPWKENPYITRGYRFCKGYTDCLFSLTRVHNETCNIWSHLIGLIIMLGLAIYHWPTTASWTQSSKTDKMTMIMFLAAASKCLLFSASWHTFNGISKLRARQSFACADYTGITILIAASILTTEYSALYCNTVARNIYMVATIASGVGGAVFTWDPSFDTPASRPKRVMFFVGFAVVGIVGFIHASIQHGFLKTFLFYSPVLKSIFCYSLGVVVYSMLIPERWWPGTIFDYCGMSHNLWHICVFGGIYYHYKATVFLLGNAKEFSCTR